MAKKIDLDAVLAAAPEPEERPGAIQVREPANGTERKALEYAGHDIGSDFYQSFGDAALDPKTVRDLAASLNRIDLKKFGINDRHLKVTAGLFRSPGQGHPSNLELRIQVMHGAMNKVKK